MLQKTIASLVLLIILSGCTGLDEAKFQCIHTGMSRDQVIATLGQPTSTSMNEVLGLTHETLTYRSPTKTWQVNLAIGYVVAKSEN